MLSTVFMFVAAIALSCVAGYYSVIGMTSIFSGAFIPIIIMTGILETSKVIVASWLYNHWNKTPFALKAYLSVAVVILMCITSMGIFGYLSKAHIEQAAAGQEQQAQLTRIADQIATQAAIIESAKAALANVNNQNNTQDTAIKDKIAQSNKLIDDIRARYQPQIDQQQKIIDDANATVELQVKNIQAQIDDLDNQLANLDAIIKSLIDQKYASKAQTKQEQQKPAREEIAKKKDELNKQIETIRTAPNSNIDAANAEITNIRNLINQEIAPIKTAIDQLTSKLNENIDFTEIQTNIDAQNARIKSAQDEIDQLNNEKFKIQGEQRKLEVEVGPLKYIAEMLYGNNPDASLLEQAVRGVIIVIIVVFDPLALLMLIAANQGLVEYGLRKKPVITPPVQETTNVKDTANKNIDIDSVLAEIATLKTMLQDTSTAAAVKPTTSTPLEDVTITKTKTVNPVNHTVSFNGITNDLKIIQESNVDKDFQYEMSFDHVKIDDEPIVRTPVVEDEIPTVDNIDRSIVSSNSAEQMVVSSDVKDQINITNTSDFLSRLEFLHNKKIEQYLNNKSKDQ